MKRNHIIIPTDLSEVGQKAVEYAGIIGNKWKSEITLIHIVPEIPLPDGDRHMLTQQKIFRDLEKELSREVAEIRRRYGLNADFMFKEGHIFGQIAEAARDVEGGLIIIGTHGKQGIQYLTGSYMARVIASSDLPVMVLKRETPLEIPQHLFVGLDFEGASEAMLNVVALFAATFRAKVTFVSPEDQRGALLEVREKLEKNVDYQPEFEVEPEKGSAFIQKVCQRASENEGGIALFKLEERSEKARVQRLEGLLAGNLTKAPVVYVYSEK
ncbi:MAG: universal stress protein [Bacteroidia bacterium]|nr:universal stress protein [Bacteroidia bacterium]